MSELKSILKLEKPAKLIHQLMDAGYAFACWKMPQENRTHFIIGLSSANQVVGKSLTDFQTGFLINRFSDNHPCKPYYIPADIIIQEDQISLNPRVSSTMIDQFKEQIQSSKSKTKESNREPVVTSDGPFKSQVAKAILEIKNGTFEKVVLSRYSDAKLPEDFSPWHFFQTLCERYESAFCSMSYVPGHGLWMGATPEILISESPASFKTVSLAGTKKLEADQSMSQIAWTQKEIEEQAFVSRYIINCFKKIRLREFKEHGPKTIQAGQLAHLKTEFEVDYREIPREGIADQMLQLLHPTSAVCGMPIDRAKPWIESTEHYDRSFYAGFLGPVNYENQTNLFVNLRCMKVEHDHVRFFAGAGITEDSDPDKEYEETEMKMNVLRNLMEL